MPGFLTNDLPTLAQIGTSMRIPIDTEFARGANPASVAGTALQIAGTFAEVLANPSTSTSGAVTSNHFGGLITTEALATAVGFTYNMDITNSLITAAYLAAGGMPVAEIYSGTNTGGNIPPDGMSAIMTLTGVITSVGNVIFSWRNDGSTPLNGTMSIVWHL
jgi:hypothetical protein